MATPCCIGVAPARNADLLPLAGRSNKPGSEPNKAKQRRPRCAESFPAASQHCLQRELLRGWACGRRGLTLSDVCATAASPVAPACAHVQSFRARPARFESCLRVSSRLLLPPHSTPSPRHPVPSQAVSSHLRSGRLAGRVPGPSGVCLHTSRSRPGQV
jgi:hypothetical protein